MTSLIADPDLSYAELAGRLRALDWEWRSESQEMPTIPGEPEWVVWGLEGSETSLVYSFNPVVRLRVLAFSGPDADKQRGRVASFLPHLTAADVAELLTSTETEPILLGLFAARELALAELQPLVLALTMQDEELVARVARQVVERLPPLKIDELRASLFGPEMPDTDRLGIFSRFAGATIRRQVIRVAGRRREAHERMAIEFLVETGLKDPDWEVRASAMLVAARQGLDGMTEAVATIELPEDEHFGHSELDRSRLEALRAGALRRLRGEPSPRDPDNRHAWDCVLDQVQGRFDGLFLLAYALSTPFEPGAEPTSVPPGMVASDQGLVLAKSRLPLAWVAPVPCWLGDPDGGGELPNPLRRVVPSSGFFIARRPLSRATVKWILAGGKGPSGIADGHEDADHCCDILEAKRVLESLEALEGCSLRLPTADQWEIAARGPDGRRFPWGNGLEPGAEPGLSPWGLERMGGAHPHWTATEDGGPVACGGSDLRCDHRGLHLGGGLIRPVVPEETCRAKEALLATYTPREDSLHQHLASRLRRPVEQDPPGRIGPMVLVADA